ncbi:EH domain-containing and endocytosis protein 1-like [Lycium barbarum]|uniref:EH domain-containing and endocytosis protein 1-like n=1 Tax=Lycium barbarum TaxID=112863 RepID=UPI00293E240D|nr:EH domain-containing and endocytosis protein 1-like [Lycium barbarum]
MFSATPPATGEAAGFGHLPIPRVTRSANRQSESGSRDNLSVVLVNEAFIRAQHEMDDLRGQLDAQGRETEKYKHLLREKEEELSQVTILANLRPELDAAKDESRRLKNELAAMTDYNRSLEADKICLSRDKAQFSSRLDELETTVSQLRGELDLVKADATILAERNRQLESDTALYEKHMKVSEEKAEERSRMSEGLKAELEEAVEADLEEAWKGVETAEAHTAIVAEYEKWKSRRLTLEEADRGLSDLPALITQAKEMEEEANRALGSDSDDSERTESDYSDSSRAE